MDHVTISTSLHPISLWWAGVPAIIGAVLLIMGIFLLGRLDVSERVGWSVTVSGIVLTMLIGGMGAIIIDMHNYKADIMTRADLITIADHFDLVRVPNTDNAFIDKSGQRYTDCVPKVTKINDQTVSAKLFCIKNGTSIAVTK